MRFRENTEAQQAFQDSLGGNRPAMRIYVCSAGDWQFVITYDTLHNVWAATYQARHPAGNRVSAKPVDSPPPGEQFKHYESQREAEKACERKYRQLREDN